MLAVVVSSQHFISSFMSAGISCKSFFPFLLRHTLIFDRSLVMDTAHEDSMAEPLGKLYLTFLLRGTL